MTRSTPPGYSDHLGSGILGTGSCLPKKRVPSHRLARSVQVADGWIEERIGVLERRFVEDGETGLDLAVSAAESALAEARVPAEDLAAVILATSTPDLPIPGIGPRLQGAIGARNAVAFDVNAACAGFLVACELGRGLLAANARDGHVLVVATDTYSHILDPSDRRTYPLFGDGAGAVVLGRVAEDEGIIGTRLHTDGRLAHYVSGGPSLPVAPQTGQGAHHLKMAGRDVAGVVRAEFPRLVNDALKEHDITVEEIDHLICHQANPRLIRECAAGMGFTSGQLVITGDRLGNTAAASIPIGLDTAVRGGLIAPGDLVLMVTFGAGMSWGRTLLRWPSTPSTGPSTGPSTAPGAGEQREGRR